MTDPASFSLTIADIERELGSRDIERGRAYAKAGRVSDLVFTQHSGDEATAKARVRGTRRTPYALSIFMKRKRDGRLIIENACDCPIGRDCKHVAATLFVLLKRDASRALKSATTKRSTEVKIEEDPRVDSWLSVLRDAAPTEATAPIAGAERVAYIFVHGYATSNRGSLSVRIVGTRLTKAGHWAILRDIPGESLAAAKSRIVAPDDAVIGHLLSVLRYTYRAHSPLAVEIVRHIVATGRAHYANLDTAPLTLGPSRLARVEWMTENDGTQRPSLAFDGVPATVLPGSVAWYVEPESGLTGPIESGLAPAMLVALLSAPALAPAQAKRVRHEFERAMPAFALPPPREIEERVVAIEPVPMLTLRTVKAPPSYPGFSWRSSMGDSAFDIAEFSFAYGSVVIDAASSPTPILAREGEEIVSYARSSAGESRFAQRLAAFDFYRDPELKRILQIKALVLRCSEEDDNEPAFWTMFAHKTIPELRAEGWQITIDPSFRYRVLDLASDDLWHTDVREGRDDWFSLAIGVDIEGQRIALLPLLRDLIASREAFDDPEAIRLRAPNGTHFVRIGGSNTTIAFPVERLIAIVSTLAELVDPDALEKDGTLRLPRVRATAIGDLEAAAGLRWNAPARLRALGERLRTIRAISRVAVPKTFRGELRDYQRDGLDWLQFLAEYEFGGILADDMGLGKSVQTLAHLLCEKKAKRLVTPALLVVPKSLVSNWIDEATRFAPSLRVLALHGPARAQSFSQIAEHDLVITTYPLLVRDDVYQQRDWHAVILDEAQALKNPLSKGARAAITLRAAHRLLLTGTPVENHLGDLWSLFSIALPGALGDRKAFTKVFRTPIEKHGNAGRGHALQQRIAPFVLRRTKEAVASELPEKTEIVRRVELSGGQRDLYETVRLAMHARVRQEIEARGLARSQIVILDALLKLRQVCCDPRLLPERFKKTPESVKLELLLEMLPQMIEEGRRILVFSQFTSMLDLIKPELTAREIPFVELTGKTNDRGEVVKKFQSGAVPIFLISLKAGGTGLNLTAADTVIHYDPWWNPAVERQATDRAHRIGQTQHVFVYKFIGAGTVEEKIVAMQTRKAALAASIFAEKADGSARFALEDIERLFAPLEA